MIVSRRNFFGMLAAPAVIRIADLMPVKTVIEPIRYRGPIQFIGIPPVNSHHEYVEATLRFIAHNTGIKAELLSCTWPEGRLIPSEKAIDAYFGEK